MANRMYQSFQGPTDPSLTHSLTEGYQPVSRIGEVVINSFGAPQSSNRHTCARLRRHGRPRRAPSPPLVTLLVHPGS